MGKKEQDKRADVEKNTEGEGKGGLYPLLKKMKDERIQTAVGLVLLTFGLYLALAFVSFFFTGWQDQSLVQNTQGFTIDYINENVRNWAGLRGAKLADFFINRTFGISCLLYLFFYFLCALWLMHIRPFRMCRTFLICSFFLIWLSLFFGFFFVKNYESTHLFWGGEHGYFMSIWLRSNVGVAGTALLLILSLILFVICAYKTAISRAKMMGVTFISKVKNLNDGTDPAVVGAEGEPEPEGPKGDDVTGEGGNGESTVKNMDGNDGENDDPSKEGNDPTDDNTIIFTDKQEGEKEGDNNAVSSTKGGEPEFIVNQGNTENYEPQNDPSQANNEGDNLTSSTNEGTDTPKGGQEPVATDAPAGADNVDFQVDKIKEDDFVDQGDMQLYDPTKELSFYKKPSTDLFDESVVSGPTINMEEQTQNKNKIVEVLKSFGVEISSIKATVGPTVTLYEVTPAAGVRISRIRSLGDDIALCIAAKGIRIIAPIPGKGTIGIEVPNNKPQTVPMADIINSKKFQESKYELPIAIGKTITNEVYMVDLCKMPHVLVAGATGQGKSVGLNAIITSILYKKHPAEVKFVMVDPKMVEFSMYAPIEKHFLAKIPDAEDAIITDVNKVVETLKSLCVEMDDRYMLLKDANVRQLKEYNEKFINRRLNPLKGHRFMPYIVVIIDEFADLIMQVGKEVEQPIARIAQKARAVGIHMILATQRPSANIITGVIRANFPARFAFKVSTGLESRVILDQNGAEQLIGRGDMLISQGNDFERVQCAFVDTPEVERITQFISEQQGYQEAYALPDPPSEGESDGPKDVDLTKLDPRFEEAAALIVSTQQGSTSMIQRKLSLGYNRAGRLMDQLEVAGIVGPQEGSKPREVKITDLDQLDMIISKLKNQ